MPNGKDWLQDPLREVSSGRWLRLKSEDERQNDLWYSFHFATRLKLDGADHFCRQALGAASMPYDLGLPLLAHRQIEWYLGAFFFVLASASDTLLQELNVVYAYDLALKPEDVRWNKKNKKNKSFMDKLPEEIFNYIEEEREKNWLYEVRSLRNMATHQYLVPLSSGKVGWGDKPLDYSSHDVSMLYQDKEGNLKKEKICVCREYLKNMVSYISSVWEKMAQEFQ